GNSVGTSRLEDKRCNSRQNDQGNRRPSCNHSRQSRLQHFRRADRQDQMKEGQPTKAPTKQGSCWSHAEHEHENEQYELPSDVPNEHSSATDKCGKNGGRSDQAASQLRCRVRTITRGKVRPV